MANGPVEVRQALNREAQDSLRTPAFVAVVPARLGSTRLPNKPLADIGGKPMVVRVAERAFASGATRVIVATDSQHVFDAVAPHGFEVMLTSPDHPSGTDRLAEVAAHLGWPDDTLVVNVQGDEPLIDPALIVNVAAHLAAHPECAIATAAHPMSAVSEAFDPNAVKVVIDSRGIALYFSRAPIPWFRDTYRPGEQLTTFTTHLDDTVTKTATASGASDSRTETDSASPSAVPSSLPSPVVSPVYRHIGIYAYRAGFLRRYPALSVAPIERAESLEQLRAMWHGERIAVLVTETAPPPGVDTPEDLARARAAFAAENGLTVA